MRVILLCITTLVGGVSVYTLLRPRDTSVEVLVDAGEVFPAVLELIRGARREVLLSMYLLGGVATAPGSATGIGREIVDALLERQDAGVAVRVLNTRFEAVPDPRAPGTASLADPWFTPVFDHAATNGLAILRPAVSRGAIDHTKYLVVDGREAIFGGMNLADAVASNHDVMVRVAGPAAATLRETFEVQWAAAKAAVEAEGKPTRDPAAWWVAWWGEILDRRDARVREGADRCDVALAANTLTEHPVGVAVAGALDSLRAGDRLRFGMLLLTHGPTLDRLLAAHARGVDVRGTVDPGTAFYGVDCGGSANAASLTKLDAAGVPVRVYTTEPGQELHMKVFVVHPEAGEPAFGVGSANWAGTDLDKNWELFGLFSGCRRAAARLEALIDADWEAHAAPLTPDQRACYAKKACRAELRRACNGRMKGSWLSGRDRPTSPTASTTPALRATPSPAPPAPAPPTGRPVRAVSPGAR